MPEGNQRTEAAVTIWKYPIEITDEQNVMMPRNAKVLSVAAQNDTLTLWALVDPSAPLESRRVVVVGTGNPITGKLGRFRGTVVMPPFVWHVFIDMTEDEAIEEMF